jgi:hypothetical protein
MIFLFDYSVGMIWMPLLRTLVGEMIHHSP